MGWKEGRTDGRKELRHKEGTEGKEELTDGTAIQWSGLPLRRGDSGALQCGSSSGVRWAERVAARRRRWRINRLRWGRRYKRISASNRKGPENRKQSTGSTSNEEVGYSLCYVGFSRPSETAELVFLRVEQITEGWIKCSLDYTVVTRTSAVATVFFNDIGTRIACAIQGA